MPKSVLLFAVGSFYPDPSGGPNITMYWLSKELHKNDISVSILTTDRGIGHSLPKNKWLDLDYGRCQYVKTYNNNFPFTLLFKSIWELRKMDCIYLASFFYPLSFILAPIALTLGVKVIWAPRGEMSPNALKYGFKRKSIILRIIRVLRKKVIFHATSAAEVTDINAALGNCKVEYIPIGMEIPDQEKCSDCKRNLLFLGRIHPIKGLENLIYALSESDKFLKSSHRLLIAGYAQMGYDGALKNIIKSLNLDEKVSFLGKVEGEEKSRLLACSYALILPSFSENFGAVVAESLAQGTPAIASLGTPWAILEEKKAGYHVSNQPNELALAIDSILELTKDQYDGMCKNARNVAVQNLSITQQIPSWRTLLNS